MASNVFGGSKNPTRGTWCTPKRWAEYVGRFDLDPFSNPRSHIVSTHACMLERGDNGLAQLATGAYYIHGNGTHRADDNARVFIQPPYELVDEAITHYGHTRFCALLRFDAPTAWCKRLVKLCELVCVVSDKRMDFEPPPGVGASSNPFPHALFYRRAEDATRDVLRRCLSWKPGRRTP